jgi:hypothetical protein
LELEVFADDVVETKGEKTCLFLQLAADLGDSEEVIGLLEGGRSAGGTEEKRVGLTELSLMTVHEMVMQLVATEDVSLDFVSGLGWKAEQGQLK